MQSDGIAHVDVEAVVFDMDGVLIDSRTVIEAAWSTVARRHGRSLTPEDVNQYVHGRAGSETVRLLFPQHTEAERLAIWAEVDVVEEESAYPEIAGAALLASALAHHGVPLALATSSWPKKIANALGGLGLLPLFPLQVTRDDVTLGKPHPEPYLEACRRLDVRPTRTLVFEDSLSGVTSAVAAGTICVGVGGSELLDAGAVTTAVDFTGLTLRSNTDGLLLAGLDTHIRIALPQGDIRD